MAINNRSNCNCTGNKNENYIVSGNSIDINRVDTDIAEIRADVQLDSSLCNKETNVVRLWGQVKDCHENPIPNALLKLIKVVCTHYGEEYQGIAHTTSDCNGFYQFDLCYRDGDEVYKVLVNKAYLGIEQIIENEGGNCNACMDDGYNYSPCKEYPPIITQNEENNNCSKKTNPCGCEKTMQTGYNPKVTCGCDKTMQTGYNAKSACGSSYAQSLNMPLYGCK